MPSKVTLHVEGFEPVSVLPDQTLLDACDEAGIEMECACGGFACCNSCRVLVLSGELSEKTEEEEPFLDKPNHRLGCQAELLSSVHIVFDPGMEEGC